ncbi:hypothetical protein [Actinoallomurus sp. CA-150999]
MYAATASAGRFASPYLLGIAWRAGIRSTPIARLVRTARDHRRGQ